MAALALLPTKMNGRLWGAFHTPPGGNNDLMYTSWDFNTYFKPQMDAIKAQGWNLMTFFGSVLAGNANLATYLANFQSIFDYAKSIGLYLYPYLCVNYDFISNSSIAATVISASAGVAARNSNCIGVCYVDEAFPSDATAPIITALITIDTAARLKVPSNFSMTMTSNPCGNLPSAAGNAMAYDAAYHNSQQNLDTIVAQCNHFCFNPQAANVPGDMANLVAAFPTFPVIFGGSVAATSDGSFATIATALGALVGTTPGVNVKANANFIMADFDGSQYGMWSGPVPTGPRSTRINAATAAIQPSANIIRPVRNTYGNPSVTQAGAWGYILNS